MCELKTTTSDTDTDITLMHFHKPDLDGRFEDSKLFNKMCKTVIATTVKCNEPFIHKSITMKDRNIGDIITLDLSEEYILDRFTADFELYRLNQSSVGAQYIHVTQYLGTKKKWCLRNSSFPTIRGHHDFAENELFGF